MSVKIWYPMRQGVGSLWTSGGDIAFNELVKECLFVHGWNERMDEQAELSAFALLCITQNGRRRAKGSLGFSVEQGRWGRGVEGKKIDEILHLNGRQTGTRVHDPCSSHNLRVRNSKHMWSGEYESSS